MLGSICLERVQGFVFHRYLRTEGKTSRADMLKAFYQFTPPTSMEIPRSHSIG